MTMSNVSSHRIFYVNASPALFRPVIGRALIATLLLAACPGTRPALAATVSAKGTLQAVTFAVAGTSVPGVVLETHCEVNDIVKKGQLCARLDPRPLQSAVDIAKAELAVALAQLEKHAAKMAHAKTAYERNVPLAERGIVTRTSVETLQSSFRDAQVQHDITQLTIEQRRARLAAAELNLSYANIVTPISGVVLERRVDVGQPARISMFVLGSELTSLHAVVRVGEADIGRFRSGDKATIVAKAFATDRFEGTIQQIRNVPDSAGGSANYEVIIRVENPNLKLRPGMSVDVAIAAAG